MKFIKLALIALLLPMLATAQAVTIKEGNVKMGKTKLWSFTATYNYAKKPVTEALEQVIEEAHIKRSSHKKGFSIYKGVAWQAISPAKADYYYHLKSKKSKTMLSLTVSKGYDNYVTTTNDAEIAGNINRFLQNLDARIASNLKIKAKEEELKKMGEKHEMLTKQAEETKIQESKKMQEIKEIKQQQLPTY